MKALFSQLKFEKNQNENSEHDMDPTLIPWTITMA